MTPHLSVIVVNYNAGELLSRCLAALYNETSELPFEVWLVDNNSTDNSLAAVRERFADIHLIENCENVGFARACNEAIRQTSTDYVLLLNPDTLVRDRALKKMVGFMEANPSVGICGCRVLNRDGTLQRACRRSIPTPATAFYHLSGLGRLFPHSRTLARYNLTYIDPDQSHEVDAVSGSVLMIRRSVIEKIGLLDEQFFMYGEELDWCLRTKNAGWKVMYFADAEIVHYKGECSRKNSRKAAYEFYRSMYLFHKKHFADSHNICMNLLIYTGIFVKALTALPILLFPGKVGSKC